MNFIIIMPFSRPHNAELLKQSFASACEGMNGKASLIAVCADKSHVNLFEQTLLVHSREPFDWCYWKCNRALDQILISDANTFFGFFCDDDAFEPGIFSELEKRLGDTHHPRVAVINMKRWNHLDHPVDELVAIPQNMRVCLIGLEQYFIRGDIMAKWRFNETTHFADGDLVERLYGDMPNDFLFLSNCSPHLFVNFNKLPA